MLSREILFRARGTARNARPEPHARLTAAVVTADAYCSIQQAPVDAELMAYVVDIAADTLGALSIKGEVGTTDIACCEKVLSAAMFVRNRTAVDTPHLDTLIEVIDDLRVALFAVKVGRAD